MNPSSPLPAQITAQVIALEVLVGASIGAIIGMFIDLVLKRGTRAVLIDALLGIVGFAGGATGSAYIRVAPKTTEYREGAMVIRTTVRHYQYPYRIAFVLAIFLPLLFELIKTRIIKRRQSRASGV